MRGTLIERHIRRCNRNLLLVNTGLIAIGILMLISNQRYLYNCIAGPFPVSAAELATMDPDAGSKNFVQVTDDLRPIDTGVYQRNTTGGFETTTDRYLAGRLGKQLLLIKASTDIPAERYEGGLKPIPNGIRWLIQENLAKEGERFDDVFGPTMLDATGYRYDAYLGLLFGLPVLSLCLANIKRALNRMENPTLSPVYAGIARYNDASPEDIAKYLDDEATAPDVITRGTFTLTPSWLLHKTFFNFTPFHLNEIVWVYAKQTTTYYVFIPMGRSHSLVVADAVGRTAESSLGRLSRKKRVREFLTILTARIPWAVSGFSEELKRDYTKNLAGFVQGVVERRREYDEPTND